MAKPIPFTPSSGDDTNHAVADARAEWDALLVALHERGVLRVLNGLLRAGPEVTGIALGGLNSPAGQRAIRNAVVLGEAATKIDPARLDALVEGVVRGVAAAGERIGHGSPGSVGLLKSLNDPDVRRGMNVLLGFLKALGQEADAGG